MKNIFKILSSEFSAKQMKNCIKVTLPVVINVSGTLIDLRIKQNESGFTIYCPTNIFSELNNQGNQEYYFNIFEKYDKNYHFDIKIKNGKIFKDYSKEQSVIVALNEFVRFYIMIDNFIIDNNVIGNEEKFM